MADRCRVGPRETVVQHDRHVLCVAARTVAGSSRPNTSAGILSLYGEEEQMATGSGNYVGIDASKDSLDVAVLGEKQTWQVENTCKGIDELMQ